MKTLILAAALTLAAAPALAQAPPGNPEDMIKMMDANKDGVVTKDEAAQIPSGVFDGLDANKDGKLTVEEMKNASGPGPGGPPPGAPPQ